MLVLHCVHASPATRGVARAGNPIGREGEAALLAAANRNYGIRTLEVSPARGTRGCTSHVIVQRARALRLTRAAAARSYARRYGYFVEYVPSPFERDLTATLASRFRVPHVRFILVLRALCLAARAGGSAALGGAPSLRAPIQWVCSASPLWVVVAVCRLLL